MGFHAGGSGGWNGVTRDEFIAGYCERSGLTWEWLQKYKAAVVCSCGEAVCHGWAMVPKDAANECISSPGPAGEASEEGRG